MSSSSQPMIKSYGDLTEADLDVHALWVNCHGEDADEDAYRPHDGPPPRHPYDNLYVVHAKAVLCDGSEHVALMNLSPGTGDGADADLFGTDGTRVSLAPASMGLGENVRQANLAALGRTEAEIFPVRVSAGPGYPTITVIDWFTQRVSLPESD